jgi:ribonucleoside-diphosphate reductase alpha chain
MDTKGNPGFLSDPTSDFIIREQYVIRDENGNPTETPVQVFERVAKHIALVEAPEDQEAYAGKFLDLHLSGDFCAGGRILAGAGTEHGNLLNCYTQGATENAPDTFEGVMELAKKLAVVTKVGGGNGVNLDELGHASAEGIARVHEPYAKGPHYVGMDASHPDIKAFIQGEMTDITQYGAPRVRKPLKRLQKVVYGDKAYMTPEIVQLAAENNVMVVENSEMRLELEVATHDSITGIMDTAAKLAKAALEGKSFAVDVSMLRAENAYIQGSGGTSSGAFSFVYEIFDNFTHWALLGGLEAGPIATLRYIYAPVLRVIRQGGTRRGAGMATIRVTNPNLLDFITAKDTDREQNEGDIGTFNISVLVTQEFIELLQAGKDVPVAYHPVKAKYPDVRGHVSAAYIWNEIAKHAWSTGEPGLLFEDKINKESALAAMAEVDSKFWINKTNPCGEIPLTTGEPCDLGAMNWANFVEGDPLYGWFNYRRFRDQVALATRFLDNVLDVNNFVLPDNRNASQSMRRLGLGLMGLADALIKMGVSYDSEQGRNLAYLIARAEAETAQKTSEELGVERGVFPLMLEHPEKFENITPRRNVAGLTAAPTGTTSMAFAVTSGLEPIYSLVAYRKVGGKSITIIHPLFKEVLDASKPTDTYNKDGQWNWDKILDDLNKHHGSIQELDFPAEFKRVFKIAHDISPEDHVRMQGVIQRAFDENSNFYGNSLSKTINMPEEATVEDIQNAYTLAISEGCKGITVYRNNSRAFQVIRTSNEETQTVNAQVSEENASLKLELEALRKELAEARSQLALHDCPEVCESEDCMEAPRRRASRLFGYTERVQTEEGRVYITVNYDEAGPREVIANLGKGGGVLSSLVEALGRVVSIGLKYNVPVGEFFTSLRGIRSGSPVGFGPNQIFSVPDAIAKVLGEAQEYQFLPVKKALCAHEHDETCEPENKPLELKVAAPKKLDPVKDLGKSPECPDCGIPLVYEEGCSKCFACGTAKCG